MSGMPIRRIHRKEEFWRGALQRFRSRGGSAVEFCRREQLARSTFALWRKKLAALQAEASQGDAPQFVELTPALAPAAELGAEVEIAWPDGVRIRIGPAATPGQIAAAVDAIGGRRC